MEPQERNPIKVLLFSPNLGLGGGVAAFDALLRSRLSKAVHADPFLVGQRSGRLGRLLRVAVPLFDALRLLARVIARRHDVYHLNPSLNGRAVIRDGLFLLVLRLFRRRQVLVFFRGWDTDYMVRIRRSALRRGLFRSVFGWADRTLVLASEFSMQLQALGFDPGRIHVVTTMFDGCRLQGLSSIRPDDDETVQILFLARLVPAKGAQEVLEALGVALQARPALRLVLAGEGPEAARLHALAESLRLGGHVDFPGYVARERKARVLIDSDIFVLPSYHGEGCPNALLEAMGAGLAVIVTPVGGIPDIVEADTNGLFVSARCPRSLAEAMIRLAGDRRLRLEMGQRNREKAWRLYEAGPVTRRIEAHYRAVARSVGGEPRRPLSVRGAPRKQLVDQNEGK